MANKKKVSEQTEIFMRIIVLVVTGIILAVWRWLIVVFAIVHWFIVLFTNQRNREIAYFSEYWNTELYRFTRYLTFETNERPFPFTSMKRFGKFEK